MNVPLNQTLVGYVSQWRWGHEGGCQAHLTLHGPQDMTLWTLERIARPYWGQAHFLQLQGYVIGH